jgi:DNA-binding XRE family transcriptional regulator
MRNGFSQEELRQKLRLASRQTLNSWEKLQNEVPPLVEYALGKLEPKPMFRHLVE